MMKKPNFSYVALLRGYIDLNRGSHSINAQGQESCSYVSDIGQAAVRECSSILEKISSFKMKMMKMKKLLTCNSDFLCLYLQE
ncbi:hypothetical protein CFC21_097749 [Triticum aestivum]|uniref:Uncharacterized protein n=3 Tax=Triticum TaxID=4564 RepID=A0A9R1LV31_WHEAT|nr:hypothetical protein TRIUR3_11070 [Triticum urartu]KAF7095630.1 hypothetical protein CFC21_097749 [Triticum aestivum]